MIAPASLKRAGASRARVTMRPSTPGHDCPGLIEAALPDWLHPSLLATPGHDCPGLIEADAQSFVAISIVVEPLRGMIAPASLKRGTGSHQASVRSRPLRGMIAPASLKPRPPSSRPAFRGPLRGMIAPASLKLAADPEGREGSRIPLRGMIAPASLKRASTTRFGRSSLPGHSGA